MLLLRKGTPILSNVSRVAAIVLIFALCAPDSVQEDQNTQRPCVSYVPKYALFAQQLVKYTRRNIAKNVQRLAELVLQNVLCKNKAGIRFLPCFLSFYFALEEVRLVVAEPFVGF
jgi:hypothetical protein